MHGCTEALLCICSTVCAAVLCRTDAGKARAGAIGATAGLFASKLLHAITGLTLKLEAQRVIIAHAQSQVQMPASNTHVWRFKVFLCQEWQIVDIYILAMAHVQFQHIAISKCFLSSKQCERPTECSHSTLVGDCLEHLHRRLSLNNESI